MTRPGFRKSSSGSGLPGRFAGGVGAMGSSPFSQAQILHLMKTEFARARRYGYAVACVVMQVDRLQALADIHGVELKNSVRAALGALVLEKTRGHDHLGLLSEDRYVLVLPHTDSDGAVGVAERIGKNFGELLEVTAQGSTLALGLSMGVSSSADHETLFFDTLLSQAEVAVEWAAERGGNRVVLFRREDFVQAEEGLDRALTAGQSPPAAGASPPAPGQTADKPGRDVHDRRA